MMPNCWILLSAPPNEQKYGESIRMAASLPPKKYVH
jgi:hypothetical protein